MKRVDRRVVGRITAGLLAALACGGAFACSGLADEDAQATEDQVRIREATLKDFKERAKTLAGKVEKYRDNARRVGPSDPGWADLREVQIYLLFDIRSLLADLSKALEDATVVEGLTISEPQATEQKNNIKDAETKVGVCIGAQNAFERDKTRSSGAAFDDANEQLLSALKKVVEVFEGWLNNAPDDAKVGGVVLFGGLGTDNITGLSDTWVWNGSTWEDAKPTTSPSARFEHAMAYNSKSRTVVLFGGRVGEEARQRGLEPGSLLSDTWGWSGSTWEDAKPTKSPSARYGHAMAYDAEHDQVVLFGGINNNNTTLLSDTWVWNGSTWKQAEPPKSPSARYGHKMAYDAERKTVVLFGGHTGKTKTVGFSTKFVYDPETWVWDGEKRQWEQLEPSASPDGRMLHAMEYDSQRKQVVLFGGDAAYHRFGDTWAWDGKTWVRETDGPYGAFGHAMAYDSVSKSVVLFGGTDTSARFSDTWAWDGLKSTWMKQTPSKSPPWRKDHAMAGQ